MAYGSGVVAGRTGILMNNRMTYWHLDPDHIDCLRPGQRVRHTMNPVMVFDGPAQLGGALELVCGTPGADTQVQSNLQVISAVFDHRYTVAEALHAPRWTHYQGRTGSAYPHEERNALEIEARVGDGVLKDLKRRGHPAAAIDDWAGPGSEGAIQVHPETGALMAASDPRRDGQALVW
jgi:gamma-glutamyltranspeptidase/glutathione hydrolase